MYCSLKRCSALLAAVFVAAVLALLCCAYPAQADEAGDSVSQGLAALGASVDESAPVPAITGGEAAVGDEPAVVEGWEGAAAVSDRSISPSIQPGYSIVTFDGASYNQYAFEVLDLVNAERRKAGVAPLKMDAGLFTCALMRGAEISMFFDHVRPTGKDCFSILDEAGCQLSGTVGENIAGGFPNPASVVKGWMSSLGHRNNILSADYTRIGISCFVTPDGRVNWVQMFAGGSNDPTLSAGELPAAMGLHMTAWYKPSVCGNFTAGDAPAKKENDSSKAVRFWGPTALDTMLSVGQGFGSSNAVVLATMDGYWDALTASSIAGLNNCPVVLTESDELSSQAYAQIDNVGASKVYVAGGSAAISDSVVSQLKKGGYQVVRLAGADSLKTAVKVYEEGKGSWGDVAVVATSGNYHDALAASPYAYAMGAPIFLTDPGTHALTSETLSAIKSGGFSRVLICGGTAAVSSQVEKQLSGFKVERKGGPTAYETSALIAEWCLGEGMSANNVGVATATGYWDALTGAALCGNGNSVLVLADDGYRQAVDSFVKRHKSEVGCSLVFGGQSVVSAPTYNYVTNALK